MRLQSSLATAKEAVAAAEAEAGPLREECAALKRAKESSERTLVSLPGEIASLRDSAETLEAELAELRPSDRDLHGRAGGPAGENEEGLEVDLTDATTTDAGWHEGCSENRRETAKRDRKRRTPKQGWAMASASHPSP